MTLKTPKEQAETTDMDLLFSTKNPWIETANYKGVDIIVAEDAIDEINTNLPGFTVPIFAIRVRSSDVARPKAGDLVEYQGQKCRVSAFPGPRYVQGVWRITLEQETIQV